MSKDEKSAEGGWWRSGQPKVHQEVRMVVVIAAALVVVVMVVLAITNDR
jgi:hypothetical protein